MKKRALVTALLVAVLLAAAFLAHSIPVAAATTVPGGNVSGTWAAAGSPYLIDGDITVPAGQTLTLEPGVELVFQSWYKLTVHGTLLVEGTQGASP